MQSKIHKICHAPKSQCGVVEKTKLRYHGIFSRTNPGVVSLSLEIFQPTYTPVEKISKNQIVISQLKTPLCTRIIDGMEIFYRFKANSAVALAFYIWTCLFADNDYTNIIDNRNRISIPFPKHRISCQLIFIV